MLTGYLKVGDEVILYKKIWNSDSLIVFGIFRLPNKVHLPGASICLALLNIKYSKYDTFLF